MMSPLKPLSPYTIYWFSLRRQQKGLQVVNYLWLPKMVAIERNKESQSLSQASTFHTLFSKKELYYCVAAKPAVIRI